MKIDSGLSGYNYPNRAAGIDRKQEEPQQSETRAVARGAGTITGGSAFPNSLASALWVMGSSETEADLDFQPAAIAQDWVQDLYREFA